MDGSPTIVEDRPKFVEIYYNPDEAVRDVESKSTLLVGGFGVCGVPEDLINAISRRTINELTVVSNNAGLDNVGLGVLLKKKQVYFFFSISFWINNFSIYRIFNS